MSLEQNEKEFKRGKELLHYKIDIDTHDNSFHDFAGLALSVANSTSASMVFFADRQTWVKGEAGYKFFIDKRQDLFNGLHSDERTFIQIPDTLKHESLKSTILLGNNPIIRFIGKMPFVSESNIVLGAIYVLDDKPRRLTDNQISSLSALSRIIQLYLQFRKSS